MARSQRRIAGSADRGYRGSRIRTGVHRARRLWPYVLMAWERWQSLSPEERERYKKQARGVVDRGRATLDAQRRRNPRS
jgi:hypothetical protein